MLQRLLSRGSDRGFRSVTGMTRAEFARLLPAFTQAYADVLAAEQAQTVRRRRPGGGRRGHLPLDAEKLLFILVYVTQYPVQELQGARAHPLGIALHRRVAGLPQGQLLAVYRLM